MMNGILKSKKYFEVVLYPALAKKFPDLINNLAFGLIGEGSECFGFDDNYSEDHDFGSLCCIWLPDEDYMNHHVFLSGFINEINKNISCDIKKNISYKDINSSVWNVGRRGVLNTKTWYEKYLGCSIPDSKSNNLWRDIPEYALSTVTNGEVFCDPLGEFTRFRERILGYYPNDIWRNKISTRCMRLGQSGQYNLSRAIQRENVVYANLLISDFIKELIHLIFLLNNRFLIYDKWAYKALLNMDDFAIRMHEKIAEINYLKLTDVTDCIEEICRDVIDQLASKKLFYVDSDFLCDHGVAIQQTIHDLVIKNLAPWAD